MNLFNVDEIITRRNGKARASTEHWKPHSALMGVVGEIAALTALGIQVKPEVMYSQKKGDSGKEAEVYFQLADGELKRIRLEVKTTETPYLSVKTKRVGLADLYVLCEWDGFQAHPSRWITAEDFKLKAREIIRNKEPTLRVYKDRLEPFRTLVPLIHGGIHV